MPGSFIPDQRGRNVGDHPRGRRPMWPIILCSIAAVAIYIERFYLAAAEPPRTCRRRCGTEQRISSATTGRGIGAPAPRLRRSDSPIAISRALMVERLADGAATVHELEDFEQSGHDRASGAAARSARHRCRHHSCLHAITPTASATREFSPAASAGAYYDGSRIDGRDSIAHCVPLSSRQGGTPVVRMEKEAMKLLDALDERGTLIQGERE